MIFQVFEGAIDNDIYIRSVVYKKGFICHFMRVVSLANLYIQSPRVNQVS